MLKGHSVPLVDPVPHDGKQLTLALWSLRPQDSHLHGLDGSSVSIYMKETGAHRGCVHALRYLSGQGVSGVLHTCLLLSEGDA